MGIRILEKLPNELVVRYETGGDIIKRIRSENRIRQLDFALDCDIHLHTLAAYETGERSPKFDFMIEVLDEYGFEVVIRRKNYLDELETKGEK